ncbi:MAG: hypothetical protein AB2A00_24415 [Myxococcota bacterium]
MITPAIPPLVEMLDDLKVAHALIGGMAVGALVEPRATKDADFVVDIQASGLDALLREAKARGFAVNAEEVQRLLHSQMTRLWAADADGEPLMIVLLFNSDPFYASVLSRRQIRGLESTTIATATPEDLLLMKVLAGRPHDLGDAGRIVAIYGQRLDLEYLRHWANYLGLTQEVRALLPDL